MHPLPRGPAARRQPGISFPRGCEPAMSDRHPLTPIARCPGVGFARGLPGRCNRCGPVGQDARISAPKRGKDFLKIGEFFLRWAARAANPLFFAEPASMRPVRETPADKILIPLPKTGLILTTGFPRKRRSSRRLRGEAASRGCRTTAGAHRTNAWWRRRWKAIRKSRRTGKR